MQVYSKLPVQKLSGYTHDVEDYEPYPCLPVPVPQPEPAPTPDIVNATAPRTKRSTYFGLLNSKNDVYSIFKVENGSFQLAVEDIIIVVVNY